MPKSTYAINAALNVFLRATAYTAPTTVYVSLWNGNPTSGGTEATGGSYARQAIAFSAPSAGSVANSGTITFTNMPATTVSYVAIYDASSAGNLLYYATATATKTTNAGDTVTIAASGVTVSES